MGRSSFVFGPGSIVYFVCLSFSNRLQTSPMGSFENCKIPLKNAKRQQNILVEEQLAFVQEVKYEIKVTSVHFLSLLPRGPRVQAADLRESG